MTANLMNCLAKKRGGKPFTADDLLGIAPKGKKKSRATGSTFAEADPGRTGKMLSGLMLKIEKKRQAGKLKTPGDTPGATCDTPGAT